MIANSEAGYVEVAQNSRLDIITGPMIAGKSTRVLKLVRMMRNDGSNVMLIKHGHDVRYRTPDHVTTHDYTPQECEDWGVDSRHAEPCNRCHLLKDLRVIAPASLIYT